MFLRNRLLLFFVGILIANTCFDADGFDYVRPSGFYMSLVIDDCDKGYYVAKCGDINLDLNTILGYINEYYNISPLCWNQDKQYEEMHYLLHLGNDDNATYTSNDSAFYTHFKLHQCTNDDLEKLQKLRKDIFDTCISSSYVCKKCPNDGQTDIKSSIADGAWVSFNTIADCFTQGGSDAKGTFTVEDNNAPANKCYYNYYSE